MENKRKSFFSSLSILSIVGYTEKEAEDAGKETDRLSSTNKCERKLLDYSPILSKEEKKRRKKAALIR